MRRIVYSTYIFDLKHGVKPYSYIRKIQSIGRQDRDCTVHLNSCLTASEMYFEVIFQSSSIELERSVRTT